MRVLRIMASGLKGIWVDAMGSYYGGRDNGKETDLTGSMTEQEKEIARLKRELRDTQDALAILKKLSAF